MPEIAEAISELAAALQRLGTIVIIFGVLFLFFKNMGGNSD